MKRSLLVGREPPCDFGCRYVTEPPYDGVVIGSLTLGQLLHFSHEPVLEALAEDAKSTTVSITLELVYADGQWWVVPSDDLIRAISGGITN